MTGFKHRTDNERYRYNQCLPVSGGFLVDFCTVIVANIVLSGDNAVVIALATRSLPPKDGIQGIVLGTIAAILLRIILTYFAAMLLNVPYMKLSADFYTRYRSKIASRQRLGARGKGNFRRAFEGDRHDIACGSCDERRQCRCRCGGQQRQPGAAFPRAGPEYPHCCIWKRNNIRLMGRYPAIIYIGSGILGKVAAEMILADPLTLRMMHVPGPSCGTRPQIILALGVIGAGMLWAQNAACKGRPADELEPILMYRDGIYGKERSRVAGS